MDRLIRTTPRQVLANYMGFSLIVNTIQLIDKNKFGGLIDNIARVSIISLINKHILNNIYINYKILYNTFILTLSQQY